MNMTLNIGTADLLLHYIRKPSDSESHCPHLYEGDDAPFISRIS
jgi:hypothetical protein